ncbi:hypothetical protein ACVII1_000157 [Bradyrhizobium elkanii]|jgi:hypothetical protein|uniref:Transposase n=1 Tax=Bradyrhizobium elkanii TaxID=29448 RepID=A0ABV4ER83_BRAEL|nr:hypothetical protein [Bradyrhizobium elkanii]MCP1975877.1 hypothetical protein [Bradyrhizobium elkanii]MCP1985083.1 hypothetical protein [Bradyrhizobium elkanii]MCS3890548.1 hypothetical protein [Bradyrhizobium elkanii]MCS4112929.1 hypothetical protein [Bradyrhizobium elkanii]
MRGQICKPIDSVVVMTRMLPGASGKSRCTESDTGAGPATVVPHLLRQMNRAMFQAANWLNAMVQRLRSTMSSAGSSPACARYQNGSAPALAVKYVNGVGWH